MVGPGWSMSGETNAGSEDGGVAENFGLVPIGTFVGAGYNVLTWDPRGFGGSGGTVQVDDPDFEGRDAQALIDFIAEQPEAQLDERAPRIHGSGWPAAATAAASSWSSPDSTIASTRSCRRSPGTR